MYMVASEKTRLHASSHTDWTSNNHYKVKTKENSKEDNIQMNLNETDELI